MKKLIILFLASVMLFLGACKSQEKNEGVFYVHFYENDNLEYSESFNNRAEVKKAILKWQESEKKHTVEIKEK